MKLNNNSLNVNRRSLIKYSGGFIGTSLIATMMGNDLINPPIAEAQNKDITPDQALEKLVAGNDRFINQKRTKLNQDQNRLTEVAQGQETFGTILGCADSRVPAEIIFDQGFGDLFVCRVAGNIATPKKIGSLIKSINAVNVPSTSTDEVSLEKAAKANIAHQVEVLKKSPVLSDLITKGQLKIVGSYYDLDTGKVFLI